MIHHRELKKFNVKSQNKYKWISKKGIMERIL